MRLTVACLFRHTINGNIFAGKYRLVKKVTGSAVKRLKEDFAREDQIMKLLRNPYLTKEESAGHAKELGKHDIWITKKTQERQMQGMRPNVTIEERLFRITGSDKWD